MNKVQIKNSENRKNLELNLGKVCNNRCIFCLDRNSPKSARKWLPLKRAIEEMENARGSGITSLGLLGGEPTAHPRIIEIVEYAKKLGFERIALATNGLKLSDLQFTERLIDAGVTRIGISIHGHKPEIEDYLSGRNGNFEKKFKAIKNLVKIKRDGKLRDNLSLNAVLTSYNFDKMPAFCAFFKKIGITDIRFNLIRTDSCMEKAKELTPRLSDISKQILLTILANEKILHIDLSFGDIPLCIYPTEILVSARLSSFYIGEMRDLDTSCAVFLSPDDASIEAQRFNWKERKTNALKIKSSVCAKCKISNICEGIWRSYAETYGTSELKSINSLKNATKNGNE